MFSYLPSINKYNSITASSTWPDIYNLFLRFFFLEAPFVGIIACSHCVLVFINIVQVFLEVQRYSLRLKNDLNDIEQTIDNKQNYNLFNSGEMSWLEFNKIEKNMFFFHNNKQVYNFTNGKSKLMERTIANRHQRYYPCSRVEMPKFTGYIGFQTRVQHWGASTSSQ